MCQMFLPGRRAGPPQSLSSSDIGHRSRRRVDVPELKGETVSTVKTDFRRFLLTSYCTSTRFTAADTSYAGHRTRETPKTQNELTSRKQTEVVSTTKLDTGDTGTVRR